MDATLTVTHVIPFFGYPAPSRKAIYTTNAIQSVRASIRKVTAKRGAFPTTNSVRTTVLAAGFFYSVRR